MGQPLLGQAEQHLYLLPALTLESLPGFFREKNPHLFFQVREEKDHSSPSALAVFQVLLEHLGLSPLQCSFLGLHKLHPYHLSLIRAPAPLNSGTNTWGQCDPTAPWDGGHGTSSTSCFPCHTPVVGILYLKGRKQMSGRDWRLAYPVFPRQRCSEVLKSSILGISGQFLFLPAW